MALVNVHLRVIGGHDLPKTDLFSQIDPYVVVSAGGVVLGRTTSRDNNPNPVWEEDFFFEAEESETGVYGSVTLQLYDEEVTVDEHVGSCELELGELEAGALFEALELPLRFNQDKRGKKWAKSARNARLVVQVIALGKAFSSYVEELAEVEGAVLDEAGGAFLLPVPDTEQQLWAGMRFGPRATQLLLCCTADPKADPNVSYDLSYSGTASLRLERLLYRKPVRLMGLKVWSETRALNVPVDARLSKSDIGKGCAASLLGRLAACACRVAAPGHTRPDVRYVKLEPGLQFRESLLHAKTTSGFEVVADPDANRALVYDSDVGRARFLIPGFQPAQLPPPLECHLSLGEVKLRALERHKREQLEGRTPPCSREESALYAEELRRVLVRPQPPTSLSAEDCADELEVLVVELGGTAGEREHGELLALLLAAIGGKPALHVHVTMLLPGADAKSKPAQLSLRQLLAAGWQLAPDVVMVRHEAVQYDAATRAAPLARAAALPVRVAEALAKLASSVGGLPGSCTVVPLVHDPDFPERSYLHALVANPAVARRISAALGGSCSAADVLEAGRRDAAAAFVLPAARPLAAVTERELSVVVFHDGRGEAGHAMLALRLRVWGSGRVRVRFVNGADSSAAPELSAPAAAILASGCGKGEEVAAGLCTRCLQLGGGDGRDVRLRADWQGTLEEPTGALVELLRELTGADCRGSTCVG
ncbi:hypothetical protein TSOC_012499 [Tetrabaena socialis]|uniref:C2 domain-containing protein n=1 Tax=Tetrabaena socialis TaxID=47790 RepID=A0A2J7ZMW3_9CHLO|nr:hypothetical protein TSOC_012499 [Tetrabaena socialis]|eukprot:PNH01597.1 hypothetical protein TSOC_012499 [Tetrabaena socialis]